MPQSIQPALIAALKSGDIDNAERLVASFEGALNDLQDGRGHSLLTLAATANKNAAELCKLLISTGLSPHVRDSQHSRTALMNMVRWRGKWSKDVIRVLARSVDDVDEAGATALMFAAVGAGMFGSRKGNVQLILELLNAGADLDIRDHNGKTALGRAVVDNPDGVNESVVDLLRSRMLSEAAMQEFRRQYVHRFDDDGVLTFASRS